MRRGPARAFAIPRSPSRSPILAFVTMLFSESYFRQIKGGTFSNHIADFGGFLFAESGSHASCTGVSILNNHAVEGGAIYATNGVTLDWACHIGQSFALAGPAM